jgi:phosphatidate cytidylyltransferase
LGSRLWVKVYWWIPIFLVFVAVLAAGAWLGALVAGVLCWYVVRELRQRYAVRQLIAVLYAAAVAIGMLCLPVYLIGDTQNGSNTLIVVALASPLSDVLAFFLGNYAGRHRLPSFINDHKAWEGVGGQLIGALLGVWLLGLFVGIPAHWGLGLAIGAASAVGDIANSIVKRRLDIKDWAQTIPGHGGVLDRFSSLSFALATGFVWLVLVSS